MVLAIVIAPARRLPPDKLKAAKLEFQLMMDFGIYRPSDSPWTNPHHMIPDPTHHGFQCAACLGEDLFKGGHRAFHHITVEQQDIKKTTVNTLFGLFEFRKMPFGLKNAAQSWQRFINSVLKEFDFVFACRDDLLIASFSKEQHFKHLRLLFAQYLTPTGQGKVNCGVSSLQSNLGTEEISRTDYLLPTHFQDSGNELALLQRLKKDQSEATLLAHSSQDLPLVLMTDTSSLAVGGALHQRRGSTLKPLAFFSRKLDKAQRNYSTYDRELLALYLAIKNFRYAMKSRDFTIYTDHRPLT
ncbi:Uncharacterized protein APZ42_013890 [Daphnia magna]|uniref:Uncharacterized protein n=1 Tax=Daphnia magna TaxID=35525 RepID=A0A162QE68_9CRUS|nr:Uncharacterized protein APZ42_013890 [Daphnia magna]